DVCSSDLAREEFEQQRTVEMTADQVRARYTVVAGADRMRQIMLDIGGKLAFAGGEQRVGIARRELGEEPSAAVAHTFGLHQENELVRFEAHGDLGGDLFEREVEDLAGGRG